MSCYYEIKQRAEAPLIKKLIITFLFIGISLVILLNGGMDYFDFENLKENKAELLSYADANYWQAIFFAGGIFILSTIFNLPGAAIISLAIGFIFGRWSGVVIASISSTIGAVLVFLLARYLFADWTRTKLKAMKSTKNIMAKFDDEALNYLIFMRMVPLFPFWLVNLTFACSPISTRHYIFGTFIGMLPVLFVLVNLGQSLSTVESFGQLFSAEVMISFVLLAVLAVTNVFLGRKRRNKLQS